MNLKPKGPGVFNISNRKAISFIGLFSFGALLTAIIAQYVFNLQPCQFCIYERYFYAALLFLSLLGIWNYVNPSFIKGTMIIVILGAIGLTSYHIAVERKWVDPPASCTSDLVINKNTNVKDLKAQILAQPRVTRCDIVPIRILGLSMAEYNLVLNIMLLSVLIFLDRRRS